MGRPTYAKEKTNGLVQVKRGVGDYLRERENKWISTGKKRGGGTNLRTKENKWISTCKNRGRGTNLRKRENKWISTGKTGMGDQPKDKRKQMD